MPLLKKTISNELKNAEKYEGSYLNKKIKMLIRTKNFTYNISKCL